MSGCQHNNQQTPEQFDAMKKFFEKQHNDFNNRLFDPKPISTNDETLKQILDELKGIKFELVQMRWRDQATDFQRFWAV